MNFVVDANLSPRVAELLTAAGHDAVHVRDIGMLDASDGEVIDDANSTDQVVNSHDTDFGTLLVHRRLTRPSFNLMRSSDPIDVHDQADLIIADLGESTDDVQAGAIAVFARGRLSSSTSIATVIARCSRPGFVHRPAVGAVRSLLE